MQSHSLKMLKSAIWQFARPLKIDFLARFPLSAAIAIFYSIFKFDNLSLGPVAAMLTNESAEERTKLEELDRGVELDFRWKTINDIKSSIRGKLHGKDVW